LSKTLKLAKCSGLMVYSKPINPIKSIDKSGQDASLDYVSA